MSPATFSGAPALARRSSNRRSGKVNIWVILAAFGGVLLVVGVIAWRVVPGMFASQRADLLYHHVKEEPLEITVIERGALEAARNDEIICKVKASGRGSLNASTIKWIVDDGIQVHQGEKLVELDKSGLEDQKITQQIAVDKARSDVVGAENDLKITESQNLTDLKTAEVALELAKLDYEKYVKGEYIASKEAIEGQLKDAESNLEAWRDRAAYSRRMADKKFMSSSQAEADEARLQSAELALSKLKNDYKVLVDFMKRRTETDLQSKIQEAERARERVNIQNEAKYKKGKSDLDTKRGVLKQEDDRLKDLEEQLVNCTMFAPKDGMVVYYVDERARGGFGSQQATIAQGEPVREGQKLIRIPDLDHMLVNTKVHEAMVSRIRTGMKVDVKVDAFPDRVLQASVRTVATVAIQNDWRSADVKMYQTMISIDESLPGLKPGMSAEVIVHVDATGKPVPTVPVQAIVGGPEMGTTRIVFVRGANGQPEEREVEIGLSNDKIAEIRKGLKSGDEVVLNPKVLVGDRMRTRQPGDFNKQGGPNGNGQGGPGQGGPKPGGAPGGATPGGGAAPGGPGASPGGGPASGAQTAGAPGGAKPQFDPSMMNNPEFIKKMKEDPRVQKIMKDQGVDDPSKIDWQKAMKAAGGGAPGGGPGARQ
jgi:RND family efflux transporter MFP subunit